MLAASAVGFASHAQGGELRTLPVALALCALAVLNEAGGISALRALLRR
jgi:hypothetical protein